MKTTSPAIPSLIPFSALTRRALAVSMLFCATGVPAAQLIWDPLHNNGTTASSGNWDTTAGNTNWFNGTTDVVWSQTSTTVGTQGATFNGPDAAPGTYTVTLDVAQIAATNVTINNNGYVFAAGNALFMPSSSILTIAAGKTATFNCNIGGSSGTPFWVLNSGSTMNVAGNIVTGQQLRLMGPSDSLYNLTGPANAPTIMFVLAPVAITNGTLTAGNNFFIGYPDPATTNGTGPIFSSGSVTVGVAGSIIENSGIFIMGRMFGTPPTAGQGLLTIQNGGTVTIGTTKAENLAICYDGNAGNAATVNVQGGTLNVGSSGFQTSKLAFFNAAPASVAGETGVLNQTGGTINAWGGIVIGNAGGAGTANFASSGGTLYVGPSGIITGSGYTGPFTITLSGGTVGALGSWPSSLPITLTTTNGNVTFQCADNNNSPFNISLSGPLTGPGGLVVNGGGTLTLSGVNSFAGGVLVSNGTLAVVTGATPTANGPVTLDGTAGSPSVSLNVSSAGQYWTNNGTLTFLNAVSGTPTINFAFGSLPPGTTVAPLQVSGGVAFTATPNVNVSGASIATGTYPLIKYAGSVSGTLPSVNINLSGGFASGTLVNNTGTKTISLVVSSSTFSPALSWRVGSGVWDINTTANWTEFGSAVNYTDGNAVIFDDTATGPSPIAVALNTTVNPLSVTFNNAAPTNYSIGGASGSIAGSANLSVLNSGSVTLSGANTYSGGTTVSAGQLNINNGGNSGASAIGTGQLTLASGATLDNTSGSDVTLLPSITENWNGNFSYAGSANNFSTGPGTVLLNGNISVSVAAHNLTVPGGIFENNSSTILTKTGNGALTLPVANSISGGVVLAAGQLNVGDPNCVGSGILTIQGGTLDNSSGAPFVLSPASYVWSGSFTFLGSTNLELLGLVSIPNGLGNITLNVAANTLTMDNDIANNNTTVIKTGNGTWELGGTTSGLQSLGLVVNAGQVNLNKFGGQAITGGNSVGLTVQSNALVLNKANFQIHSDTAVAFPVVLSGGIWDLNGFKENVDEIAMSLGGTLRNGAATSTSTLRLISGHPITLGDTNCIFDVDAADGTLNILGVIAGSGALVKNGPGALDVQSNATYSGSTTINNGTLALQGTSSLSNTAAIILASSGSILDMSSNVDISSNSTPVLILQSGQALSGFGTVNGLVQTLSGSTLAPGSAATLGVLTVSGVPGTNVLNGITSMKLNETLHTSDELVVSGTLQYGGALSLNNLSGSLVNGDSFTLFSAGNYLGSFTSISPATPGAGLAWDTTHLASTGTLAVIPGTTPSSPKITGVSRSGSIVTLSGNNGNPNSQFIVLGSANVAALLSSWTPVSTNNFDSSGNFNLSFSATNTASAFFVISTH